MATYSELIAQKQALAQQQAALEKQIADQLNEQRAAAIAQVKSIMAEFGLSVADLGSGKAARAPKNTDGATVSSRLWTRPRLLIVSVPRRRSASVKRTVLGPPMTSWADTSSS